MRTLLVSAVSFFVFVSLVDADSRYSLGYRACRVHAIFSLPDRLQCLSSDVLAYVELFTPFDDPGSPHRMLTTSQAWTDGRRRSLVIPVTSLIMSCHLAPDFSRLSTHVQLGPHMDIHDEGRHFFLNHYYNHFFFSYARFWRRFS